MAARSVEEIVNEGYYSGTCFEYSSTCGIRVGTIDEFLEEIDPLLSGIDLCLNNSVLANELIKSASTNFENGAYTDSVHDYGQDLTDITENFTSGIESLTSLKTELETIKSELTADRDFCTTMQTNWSEAGVILYEKETTPISD